MMATWNPDLDTEDADQDSECNYENSGGTSSLPELRILLVGSADSGKSSAANMILGKKEADLKMNLQSVKRHAEVNARKLVVIEAPGWWQSVDESPAILKQEFVLSLSLCAPGPHAVLVVIDGDSVLTDKNKNKLKGFLNLLGEPVWNHCIVLFLFADYLGYTTAEHYIESEGKNVQWLVEKCGNRYHVFQKKEKSDEIGDDSQVKDLLEKIDEMLVKNNGCPFEINSAVLLELEQNRAAEIERAKVRKMKLQEEKQDHQLDIGNRMQPPEGVPSRDLEESNRPPVQPSCKKSELSLEHDETKTTASFPSYISMKTDWSMDLPPKISDVSPVHDQRRSVLMGPQKNVSEECCVCNKVLQNPICLQCNHTYCRQCLKTTNFRDGCPKCNHMNPTPAGNQTQETSYRPPFPFSHNVTFGDIPCDICSEIKLKAVKLCLTCSASYCEKHVRQHYTVPALQQHLLVEAAGDLRLKRCVTHHRVLEVFCTTDQTDICTLCALFHHKGHDMKVQPVAAMRMDAEEPSVLSYMNTLDRFKILLILFSFLCVLLGVLLHAVI